MAGFIWNIPGAYAQWNEFLQNGKWDKASFDDEYLYIGQVDNIYIYFDTTRPWDLPIEYNICLIKDD